MILRPTGKGVALDGKVFPIYQFKETGDPVEEPQLPKAFNSKTSLCSLCVEKIDLDESFLTDPR